MIDKKVKISDVAELAGVSISTVSRILNHPELVKAETVEIVQNAMQQLSFVAPQTAMPIKSGRVIVLNVPNLGNPFYSEIIRGAYSSALSREYSLIISQEQITPDRIDRFLSLVKNVKAVGVIVLTKIEADALKTIENLVPVIQCCEYNADVDTPYITVDDFLSAKNVVEHILSTGRRKIACINSPLKNKYARDRREGYERVLEAAGITIPASWIIQVPQVNYEMAYSAVCQLFNSEQTPNAIFTVSDVFAAAVICAASRYGLHVPNDVVVTGFDNIDISVMTTPSITTVNMPRFQLGYTACEMLCDSIVNPEATIRNIIFNTELIIRESTSVDKNLYSVNN